MRNAKISFIPSPGAYLAGVSRAVATSPPIFKGFVGKFSFSQKVLVLSVKSSIGR